MVGVTTEKASSIGVRERLSGSDDHKAHWLVVQESKEKSDSLHL